MIVCGKGRSTSLVAYGYQWAKFKVFGNLDFDILMQ